MDTCLAQHFIFIGVCGSGKTSIGNVIADNFQLVFFDADDFHSSENINKMQKGIALSDEDRLPWLQGLQLHLQKLTEKRVSSVLACSCLKKEYRELLNNIPHANVCFVFLQVDFKRAKKRMKARKHHYMNPKLLQSQFDALELPTESEGISFFTVDTNEKREETIVEEVEKLLRS